MSTDVLAAKRPLAELQGRLFDCIVSLEKERDDSDARPASASARAARSSAALDLVRPSATLTAAERVGVYAEMYFLRLHEALADDYPTVQTLLGKPRFEELARDYFARHPSRSYTLNRVGLELPEYLDGTDRWPSGALLAEVAQLERALCKLSWAADTPVLAAAELSAVAPERWPEMRFRMTEALRVMSFDYPAPYVVHAAGNGQALPALEPRPSWAVVWRHQHTVWRQALSEPQHAALSALVHGASIAEAVQAAERAWSGELDALETELSQWFAAWLGDGMFSEPLP